MTDNVSAVTIGADGQLAADWLALSYAPLVREALAAAGRPDAAITFVSRERR